MPHSIVTCYNCHLTAFTDCGSFNYYLNQINHKLPDKHCCNYILNINSSFIVAAAANVNQNWSFDDKRVTLMFYNVH